MWSIVLRYILKHIRYWVKKNRSVETTAANNGQKKKLALKIIRKMQTNKTGVKGADPAENQTPSYSAEVELGGNEVNPWPYSCSSMQCKLCLPRETELAAYNISTSTLRKHVEVTLM